MQAAPRAIGTGSSRERSIEPDRSNQAGKKKKEEEKRRASREALQLGAGV